MTDHAQDVYSGSNDMDQISIIYFLLIIKMRIIALL